ncbi:MAG: twin-arginine translocase subunit TatC, partial [Nitrospirae bacterium]|nr:twin-arginine translocase subunit TatC [Nitrospirota bacterium]
MEDEKLPLTAHLGELRKRIIISLAALLATFAVAFNFSEDIFRAILFPVKYSLDFSVTKMYVRFVPHDKLQNTKLVFLAPAEAFWMNIKVALVAGLILALPVIFQQLWKFISPGLLAKERRYVLPFIFVTTALFIAGAAFCFFIV